MSNKTSDNNVANVEDDVKILEEFAEICKAGLACYDQTREGEAIENILAEREQKDKRIKELEEEVLDERERVMHYEEDYQKAKDEQKIIMANSIPNQVVIDAINKHKLAYEELGIKYTNTHYDDNEIRARDFYMTVTEDRIVHVLQELLEGGLHENRT